MPINKDLSVSPYFDDFNDEKNYYKVLFKPGTAVQVRELNQLQTLLQNQIEKFGNNIFKRGTIIDGVNFIYHDAYPYVKIEDGQLDGIPADPDLYVGNFAVDPTNNLTAYIVNSVDGYEATDPDMKTLYVRYINSGMSGTETAFESGATLKIYDYLDSMSKVVINNGSSGFANTDSIVFCSAISVNVSSNVGFTVGETITQDSNTHIAVIDSIESVNGKTVLRIRPRQSDLTNTAISSSIWEFTSGNNIIGSVSSATATVDQRIGFGAGATLATTADVGKITTIKMVSRGSNYWIAPYVTVKSSGTQSNIGSRNYSDLSLSGKNYIAQVTIADNAGSVGTGYAFSVTEGVIYQKGYFLRVNPQTVIVTKYHNSPDSLSIGFDSIENIVDSNADDSLLDNATGSRNQFAPGADRLNVEPQLVVISTEEAAANNEFFSIVEFSEGYAYRENKRTQFNSIMDEMAVRTNEQSGNFVLDKFLVTTSSTANQALEGHKFAVVTDPGRGYINGYRVETQANYFKNIDKGIDSRSASNLSSSIDYGNYVLVNQFAGVLNFNTGSSIQLRDTASQYLANTSLITSGTITPAGNNIGSARVRNVVYDSGVVGTASARYRVYLFDIKMNNSKSFSDVRSIHYATGSKAVADIVLTYDATSNSSICKLEDTNTGTSLLIDTGSDSTRNLTNLSYVYRATNEVVEFAPNGNMSLTLATSGEYFAYDSASLTDNEKNEITLVPTEGNLVLQVNNSVNGTASVTTGSNTITCSIAATVNKYDIGDYLALYSDSTNYNIRRVTGKQGNTIYVDSGVGFDNSTASFSRVYPTGVPVALSKIPSATATLSGGGSTLNISIGSTQLATNLTCAITYDVKVSNASPQAKTADRNNFVKLRLANNTGYTNGPWTIGIPDAFRLRKVYLDEASTVNTNSTDVTDQFYLDHNQNADYYGLGYLYKKNDATIKLTSNTYLLVQFDAFTSSSGVYTINSYVSDDLNERFADDSLSLNDLGTKVNSFEIPEVYTSRGKHFDLINCVDFRPIVANTASYAKSSAAATINPVETVSFGNNNKKFPLPETGVTFDRSYFLGRKDVVVINTNNKIDVIRGVPSESLPYPEPKVPQNTIVLGKIIVPSYPCIPQNISANTSAILDRKISNDRLLMQRIRDKTVNNETTQNDVEFNQPKAFTMNDINRLERRVSDLEYTVSLSLIESDLKDKIIPSSINPSINRFKFGFFVDDYTTKKNSDIDNPEYQADVVDSRVVPLTESTLVTHGNGYRLSSWQSEFKIINQDQASEPVPVVVVPPETLPPPTGPASPPSNDPVVVTPAPPSVNPAPPVVVPDITPPSTPVVQEPVPIITAKHVSVYRSQANEIKKKYDEYIVTMSSVPSTFTLSYDFYGDKDWLHVVKYKTDNTIAVMFSGKVKNKNTLTFNHDPTTGLKYTIRVQRDSARWSYTLRYPIDDISYSTPTAPTNTFSTMFYNGRVDSVTPGYISAQALAQNFDTSTYTTQGASQTLSISGLKPSTLHNIAISTYSGAVIADNVVIGEKGSTVNTIMTDSRGCASFTVHMNFRNTRASAWANMLANPGSLQPRELLISITSPDNTSIASAHIGSKPYDAPPIAPVPTFNSVVNGGGLSAIMRTLNQINNISI